MRDEYTTLVGVEDRIFSTAVDLIYTFPPITVPAPTDEAKLELTVPVGAKEGSIWDEKVPERARKATLEIFATDQSASVQVRSVFCCTVSWEIRVLPGILGCCGRISLSGEIGGKDLFLRMIYEVTKRNDALTVWPFCVNRRRFTRWAKGSSLKTRTWNQCHTRCRTSITYRWI